VQKRVTPTVIGLAGRRIDAADAKESRFPPDLTNLERVGRRLRAMLVSESAVALVSSAACGADLLALNEAHQLGLRRRVVLPFDPAEFRKASVTDRPGNWGTLFDKTIEEIESRGDLIVLGCGAESDSYIEVNHAIIEEAVSLGRSLQSSVSAVLVWDGKARGAGDLTEEFKLYAQSRGVPLIMDVLTV
jgi:hypothetical protein